MPDNKKKTISSIIRAKGWGVELFANGVTPGGWFWLIAIISIGCSVIMFGMEARAAHREQQTGILLMTCIIATPDDRKMAELVNENSFCGRMSKISRS